MAQSQMVLLHTIAPPQPKESVSNNGDGGFSSHRPSTKVEKDWRDLDGIKEIWRLLRKTQLHIRGAKARKYLSSALGKLRRLLPDHVVNSSIRMTNTSSHVCPETYYTTVDNRDAWQFRITNCSYRSPAESLVTVVLNCAQMTRGQIKTLVGGIRAYSRKINIIAAVTEAAGTSLNDTVLKVMVSKNTSDGEIWNALIGRVTTTYVLIGRDLEWFNKESYLDRLIREIERLGVAVVGGSYRTLDGHWYMGCKQSAYINYRLVYEDGYFESIHEGVFCDYVEGPFLMLTSLVKKMKFSQDLSKGVFDDLFLRLYNGNYESAVCPDSMFFVSKAKGSTTEEMLAFMKKWDIYEMSERYRWNHTYPCEKYTKCSRISGLTQHPCCLRLIVRALKHVMEQCEANHIHCELHAGDALSGVKMNGKFPWDLDADINFVSGNFTRMKAILTAAHSQGYGLTTYKGTTCCTDGRDSGGYMALTDNHLWMDVSGRVRLTSEDLAETGRPVTRVEYDGTWLAARANAAKFARDYYGHEMFKHVEHWRDIKINYHHQAYPVQPFMKCPKPGHNACLDQFNADGNIQFKEIIP